MDLNQSREIYVGNLPRNATEDDLRQQFSIFGTITSVRIHQKHLHSKFAFIAYQEQASAERARIFSLRSQIFIRGNKVKVNVSTKQSTQSRDHGETIQNPNQVFIRHILGAALDADEIKRFFAKYGSIIQYTPSNIENKKHEGVLTFASPQSAQAVLNDSSEHGFFACTPKYSPKKQATKPKNQRGKAQKLVAITEFRFEINYQDGDPVMLLNDDRPISVDSSSGDSESEEPTSQRSMSRKDFLKEILESFDYYKYSTLTPRRWTNESRLNRFLDNRNLYTKKGVLLYAHFRMEKHESRATANNDQVEESFEEILDTIRTINDEMRLVKVDSNVSIHFKRDQLFQASNMIKAFGLQFGVLEAPNKYLYNPNPNLSVNSVSDAVNFMIDDSEYKMDIEFSFGDIPIRIEIPFYTIEDRILFVNDLEDKVELVIPCSKPPFVYCIESLSFSSSFNWENFQKFCFENMDTELTWSRFFLPNSVWAIKVSFRSEFRVGLIDQLAHSSRVRLVFAHIDSAPITYTMQDLRKDFNSTCFDTRYYLECLISQYEQLLTGKVSSSFFAQLLNELEAANAEPTKILPKVIENFSGKLENYKNVRFHSNIYELLQESVEEELDEQRRQSMKEAAANPAPTKEIMFVRQAVFTPSRIVFYFPQQTQSNRVIRQFGSEIFLRLKFLDEDLQKFNSKQRFVNMEPIFVKMKAVLEHGIALHDRGYNFLAMSASQMRSHGCWMVCERADEIRNWMGDFGAIRCVGKYAARLGQSLSTSIEGFASSECSEIPDVFVTHNGIKYNFTDGIGKISLEKAMEIRKTLELESLPSAFQIRYRGYKGVVSVDPTIDLLYANSDPATRLLKSIQLRDSMRKFESVQSVMDVLNFSKYIPCYLNRQVIQILSSLGIKDSVFEYFQDLMLKRLINIFIDPKVTREYIKAHYESQKFTRFLRQSEKESSMTSKINYAQEPFFHDILACIHKRQSEELIKRSRIFIANGRILLGTIDEWNVLKEDEVFIQCTNVEVSDTDESVNSEKYYSKTKATFKLPNVGETFIIDCPVIVTKNPAMVAGDLRIMRAVHKKELEHMVDCIVFPAKGFRPITNMCSGSDLDGDLYWVSWDELLIPKFQDEPLEYDSGKAKELERPIVINDIIEFFVNFIKIDQLGMIANAHTAIEDASSEGVRDPSCKALANLFCTAVDFVKTGILPEIPRDIWLKLGTYPDYMEKSRTRSHRSKKIIGRMYRKCKSVFMDDDVHDLLKSDQSVEPDPAFLVKGYEKYLKEAREIYLLYRKDLERIMNHFGLKYESELFSGKFMTKTSSHAPINQDEEKEFHTTCQEMLKDLWLRMREEFFAEFINDVTSLQIFKSEPVKKASAWYHACYTSTFNKKKRILSFPWVVQDVLLRPISDNSKASAPAEISPSPDKMTKSICIDYTNSCQFYKINSSYIHSIIQLEKIRRFVLRLEATTGLFIGHLDNFLLAFDTSHSLDKTFKLTCITREQINEQFFQRVADVFKRSSWKKTVSLSNSSLLVESAYEPSVLINFVSQRNDASTLRSLEVIGLIRDIMFKNPSLVAVTYTILKLMHSDKTLMEKLSDSNERTDELTIQFIMLMIIEFCKSKECFGVQNSAASCVLMDISSQNLIRDDVSVFRFVDYLLTGLNNVQNQIELLARQAESGSDWSVSKIVMAFYRENAFEQMQNCPVTRLVEIVRSKYFSANDETRIEEEQIKALTSHFFKGIHILLKSPDLSSGPAWDYDIRAQFDKLNSIQDHLDEANSDQTTTALIADIDKKTLSDRVVYEGIQESDDFNLANSGGMLVRKARDGKNDSNIFSRIESATYKLENSSVLLLCQSEMSSLSADSNNNQFESLDPTKPIQSNFSNKLLMNRFYLDSMKGIMNAWELDRAYPRTFNLRFRLGNVKAFFKSSGDALRPKCDDHHSLEPIIYEDTFQDASIEVERLSLDDSKLDELERLLGEFEKTESVYHQVVLSAINEADSGKISDYLIRLNENGELLSMETSPIKWLETSSIDENDKATCIELVSSVFYGGDGSRDRIPRRSKTDQDQSQRTSIHEHLQKARIANKKLIKSLENQHLFQINETTGQLELKSNKRARKMSRIIGGSFQSSLVKTTRFRAQSFLKWSTLLRDKSLPDLKPVSNMKLYENACIFVSRDTRSRTNQVEAIIEVDLRNLGLSDPKDISTVVWSLSRLFHQMTS